MKKLIVIWAVLCFTITWGATQSSVSQWGITWTFDKAYEVGQFVMGDWWVVGPVTVTNITRPHNLAGHDGSMINPIPGTGQGYDQVGPGYVASRNVANSLPLALGAGKSLVSTVTWKEGDAGCPAINSTVNAPRPTGRKAAVLTCLASAPPAGSFRPSAVGNEKTLYNISQLRTDLLPAYKPVASMPTLATVERMVERIWLDHNPEFSGAYLIPEENMPHYGRNVSQHMNMCLQTLMLDIPNKDKLLFGVVQAGIDLYGSLKAGQYWGTWGGGWSHGRKAPILFTGIMLDVAEMKNIGTTYVQNSNCSSGVPGTDCRRFQEDCQTFYVSGTTTGWGGRNCNRGEYTMDNGYRFCCTSYTWSGAMLVALMMKDANGVSAKQLWNWPAFFDYVDFWVKEQGVENKGTFINDFSRQMWKAYRNNIVPVQVGGVNFSADRTTGRPPLTVTFTNQSDAKYTSFTWDFGDGTTSTDKSPVHTYNDLGTYTVKLTSGSETKTRTDYIVVKGGTLLIQAENMTLDGYVAEPGFGGRDVIKIDPTKTTGTATTAFTGASGTYKIDFYAVPERDGRPVVKLYINNTLVMNETYPSDAGMMTTAEHVVYLTDVTINNGDVIRIEGTQDAEAWARVDKMLLTQVGGGQTIAYDRKQKAVGSWQLPIHPNPLTVVEFKNWVAELEEEYILYEVYNARGDLVRTLQTMEPGLYFYRIGNNTSRIIITK